MDRNNLPKSKKETASRSGSASRENKKTTADEAQEAQEVRDITPEMAKKMTVKEYISLKYTPEQRAQMRAAADLGRFLEQGGAAQMVATAAAFQTVMDGIGAAKRAQKEKSIDPASPQFDMELWESCFYEGDTMDAAAAVEEIESFCRELDFYSSIPDAIQDIQEWSFKVYGIQSSSFKNFKKNIKVLAAHIKRSGRYPQTVKDAVNRLRKKAHEAEKESKRQKQVSPSSASTIYYPVDKINSVFWGTGKLFLRGSADTESRKTKSRRGDILAHYEADGRSAGRALTHFDKRCYIAIAALYRAGVTKITPAQIYRAMGNHSSPSDAGTDKIIDSIEAMRRTNLVIDNSCEASVYKYPKFEYDGPLLPCGIEQNNSRGSFCPYVISLDKLPPLVDFASQRSHISSFDVDILDGEARKTEENLRIEDYLLCRVLREKNAKKRSVTILFEKIYEKCGIDTRLKRSRAASKFRNYLSHYEKCGFICGYKETETGLQLFLKSQQKG